MRDRRFRCIPLWCQVHIKLELKNSSKFLFFHHHSTLLNTSIPKTYTIVPSNCLACPVVREIVLLTTGAIQPTFETWDLYVNFGVLQHY